MEGCPASTATFPLRPIRRMQWAPISAIRSDPLGFSVASASGKESTTRRQATAALWVTHWENELSVFANAIVVPTLLRVTACQDCDATLIDHLATSDISLISQRLQNWQGLRFCTWIL